jgi:hypothetical protein
MTLKTLPTLPIVTSSSALSMPTGDPELFDMMAYIVSKLPDLETRGVVGYVITAKSFSILGAQMPFGLPKPTLEGGIAISPLIEGNYTEHHLDSELEPVFQYIKETWPQVIFQTVKTQFPSFHSWYLVNNDPTPAGFQGYLGSRLLDRKAVTVNLTASKLAYEASAEGGLAVAYVLSGKGVWDAKPRGGGNSVCPAWRRAIVYSSKLAISVISLKISVSTVTYEYDLATGVAYSPNNDTSKVEAVATLNRMMGGLRSLAPDMGVYQNEVSF